MNNREKKFLSNRVREFIDVKIKTYLCDLAEYLEKVKYPTTLETGEKIASNPIFSIEMAFFNPNGNFTLHENVDVMLVTNKTKFPFWDFIRNQIDNDGCYPNKEINPLI